MPKDRRHKAAALSFASFLLLLPRSGVKVCPLISTEKRKERLWAGPISWRSLYCGGIHLFFEVSSLSTHTGCLSWVTSGVDANGPGPAPWTAGQGPAPIGPAMFLFLRWAAGARICGGLKSSRDTRPRLSNLTSSKSGCNDPVLHLPSPSPGFQPIFCRSAMPMPPVTGLVEVIWSLRTHSCGPLFSSCAFITWAPVLPVNWPGRCLSWPTMTCCVAQCTSFLGPQSRPDSPKINKIMKPTVKMTNGSRAHLQASNGTKTLGDYAGHVHGRRRNIGKNGSTLHRCYGWRWRDGHLGNEGNSRRGKLFGNGWRDGLRNSG